MPPSSQTRFRILPSSPDVLLCPFTVHLTPPCSPKLSYSLSLWVSLFWTLPVSGIIKYVVFRVWLLLLSVMLFTNTLFQQNKRRLYTWTSPDGQHWNQIDYILCSQRWRSSIQSAKTRPGADCCSDHELLIAKFRLKLKKVGKTTRPFRYDLNQIPYDYTVEVRNRFKGIDLIDRMPDELWNEVHDIVYRRQGSRPSPWKRNAKKQNGCLGRPYK